MNLSLSGIERGSRGMAQSTAARAGVLELTRTLVQEWSRDGIRLNCLGPGLVRTSTVEDSAYQRRWRRASKTTPSVGRPACGRSPSSSRSSLTPAGALITGQLLQLDGGGHLGAGLHIIALDPQEAHDG